MKKYHESWTEDEIDEYVEEFGVLVLFKIHEHLKKAEIVVHGNLSSDRKDALKGAITGSFGDRSLSLELCRKINTLAERWYSQYIDKPLYVLNFGNE